MMSGSRVFCLGLFLAGSLLLSCGGGSSTPESPQLKRIVLITIDTLRADHCGSYGYPRATTPTLDAMAAQGTQFDRAMASMASTAPSHATLLTGLYPLQHKVRKNGHRLDDSFLTLAETMGQFGYQTAAFTSTNRHFDVGNLSQGFDTFDEPEYEDPPYRRAEETMDQVLAWLKQEHNEGPLFLWVHLFDPHWPYHGLDYFPDPLPEPTAEEAAELARFYLEEHRIPLAMFKGKKEQMVRYMDLYDREIRLADQQIGRLRDHFLESGLSSGSLWVVTADHGEGMGNHNWFVHGKNIFNEQIQVPLIFAFDPPRSPGRRVDQVVEHVDLVPTLLDLMSQERGEKIQGPENLRGTSLMPLVTGDGDRFPSKFAFTERRVFQSDDLTGNNFEPGEKYAIQDLRYKYIYNTMGWDQLYRLTDDPHELNNLASTDPETASRMKKRLLGLVGELEKESSLVSEEVDPKDIERLKAIGYIE